MPTWKMKLFFQLFSEIRFPVIAIYVNSHSFLALRASTVLTNLLAGMINMGCTLAWHFRGGGANILGHG